MLRQALSGQLLAETSKVPLQRTEERKTQEAACAVTGVRAFDPLHTSVSPFVVGKLPAPRLGDGWEERHVQSDSAAI